MKKISTKIIVSLGILLLFICFGLGIVAYMTSHNALVGVLQETMPKVALEASRTIEDGIENQLNALEIIASLDYMSILMNPDGENTTLLKLMSEEVKRAGHLQMILLTKNGKALFDDGSVVNLKDNQIYEKALSGQAFVTEPILNNAGSGIMMIYGVPVRIDGEMVGALMAVRDGLEISKLAGNIKFGETGEAFIINSQGRTIAHADTNLLLEMIRVGRDGEIALSTETDVTSSATVTAKTLDTISSASRMEEETENPLEGAGEGSVTQELGFEGFHEVQNEMIEGKTGFGTYKYNGVTKVSGYAPLEQYGWSIAVSADQGEMLSGLTPLKQTFLWISSVFLMAGFLVAYLIGKGISKPIIHLSKECNAMSNGDFSRVMEGKYTQRQDELGDLARSFNNINVKVSKIIRDVVEEASSVDEAIKNVNENMAALNDEVNFMSSIIEKLSLKMDENSATSEEMNATSSEIEGAIDMITHETQRSAETVAEVSERAEQLKATAIDSQRRAQEIQGDVAVQLRKAIEQSRAVERIQVLSDAILAISSKTNLLALNAAIEASHAGSAGAGFAVVAGEIKHLAEDSKETVNEIKQVASLIIDSVNVLSETAEQVLGFLEHRVVKDYHRMVVTGEQYNQDAQLVNDMVTSLSATTEELYASIQSMTKAINDVAVASEAGAMETSDLANEVAMIVKRTGEVLQKTQDVNQSADRLLKTVSIFKV